MMNNIIKSFEILITSLSGLHNYFNNPTNYLVKFLHTSTKQSFPCIIPYLIKVMYLNIFFGKFSNIFAIWNKRQIYSVCNIGFIDLDGMHHYCSNRILGLSSLSSLTSSSVINISVCRLRLNSNMQSSSISDFGLTSRLSHG